MPDERRIESLLSGSARQDKRGLFRGIKYIALGIAATAALGFAATKCMDSCNSGEVNAPGFEKLAVCEQYLLARDYEDTDKCAEELKAFTGMDNFYKSLEQRLQQTMEADYSLQLRQAEAEIKLGNYSAAESICHNLESSIRNADYFEKRDEFMSKAGELEETAKEGDNGYSQDESGFYDKIITFYMLIGLNETWANIAAMLTFVFPVMGIARRVMRRF
ncbi:MAG: hypothetical protein KJ955_07070 [Nanoarchaeota archaeon]|nr:hypothetical protein [Nanoarchaeota archaeon]